jgi:hypothetical protein
MAFAQLIWHDAGHSPKEYMDRDRRSPGAAASEFRSIETEKRRRGQWTKVSVNTFALANIRPRLVRGLGRHSSCGSVTNKLWE